MENIKMEDIVEKEVTPTSEETTQVEETAPEVVETTEQDPLKTELERVQNRTTRTEKEKAGFTFKKQADRLKELGLDPAEVLGIKTEDEPEGDDAPMTIGMYKKLQSETISKSSLQMADEIESETERELVKYHLQNTIRSTGNPTEDFKLARSLVNAVKNTQIAAEIARKPEAKTHSNASGVDAVKVEEFKPTPEELEMMKAPFYLTKEQILESRAGKATTFKNLQK